MRSSSACWLTMEILRGSSGVLAMAGRVGGGGGVAGPVVAAGVQGQAQLADASWLEISFRIVH